jgi:hypothetical protein
VNKTAVTTLAASALLVLAGVWSWPHYQDWRQNRAASAELLRQPVYQLLAQHEPATFQRLTERYADVGRGQLNPAEFVNMANAQLSEVATRRLAHASDAAVLALLNDMVRNARSLERRSDDSCFRFLFPHVSGPPDLAGSIDAAAQARTFAVIAEVLRTAAETPQPLPEGGMVADNLASVVNATFAEHGSDAQMIARADEAGVDRRKVCAMTLSLYERILARPPADASALIRAMTQVQ